MPPRLPVRPVPPAPPAVKYDAPHPHRVDGPAHLTAAEFFADGDQDDDDMRDPDSAGSGELFTEPLDEDPDDAPVITVPLQPLPRPEPTVMHPTPASRAAPPHVRRPPPPPQSAEDRA